MRKLILFVLFLICLVWSMNTKAQTIITEGGQHKLVFQQISHYVNGTVFMPDSCSLLYSCDPYAADERFMPRKTVTFGDTISLVQGQYYCLVKYFYPLGGQKVDYFTLEGEILVHLEARELEQFSNITVSFNGEKCRMKLVSLQGTPLYSKLVINPNPSAVYTHEIPIANPGTYFVLLTGYNSNACTFINKRKYTAFKFNF
jgi:hypothetical protein